MGNFKDFKSFISRISESLFSNAIWDFIKWVSAPAIISGIITWISVWVGKLVGWITTMNAITAYTIFTYFMIFLGVFSTSSLVKIGIDYRNSKKKLDTSAKSVVSLEKEISFHPRKTIEDPDSWDFVDKKVWLEVVGILELKKYSAILRKLETENNGVTKSYLSEVTNSFSPRLKISREKIFIGEQKDSNLFISLMDNESGTVPKDKKYYIEVELMKGLLSVKKFRGYLIINKYNDINIKDYYSEI